MTSLLSREAWTRVYAWPFLAIFGLNVVVFLVFTLPRSIQERRAAARALVLREKIEARRRQVASIRTTADTVKSNLRDTQRFYKENLRECSGASGPLLQEMRGLGRELGVRADRMSTSAPRAIEGAAVAEMDVSMPLTGTYQQSATFLQRLERAPLFLVVDSISMREAAANVPEAGGTELDMRIKAYCRSEMASKRRR